MVKKKDQSGINPKIEDCVILDVYRKDKNGLHSKIAFRLDSVECEERIPISLCCDITVPKEVILSALIDVMKWVDLDIEELFDNDGQPVSGDKLPKDSKDIN